MRLQFTIAAWRSIGILGLIAVHACGDNQLIAPKTSNVARISAAVVDQSAAPSATHITLHGRRGIVHEFTLIGNVVYFAGHGSGVLSAEAADKLRAAGIEDAKLTKLVEKAEPVWAARGLNIDADTGAYAHGSSLRTMRVQTPVRYSGLGGPSLRSSRIKAPGKPNFIEDCTDDPESCIDPGTGGSDFCGDLYLQLYTDTQTWHSDNDSLSGALTQWLEDGCNDQTMSNPNQSNGVCLIDQDEIAYWNTMVTIDQQYLQSDADQLSMYNC